MGLFDFWHKRCKKDASEKAILIENLETKLRELELQAKEQKLNSDSEISGMSQEYSGLQLDYEKLQSSHQKIETEIFEKNDEIKSLQEEVAAAQNDAQEVNNAKESAFGRFVEAEKNYQAKIEGLEKELAVLKNYKLQTEEKIINYDALASLCRELNEAKQKIAEDYRKKERALEIQSQRRVDEAIKIETKKLDSRIAKAFDLYIEVYRELRYYCPGKDSLHALPTVISRLDSFARKEEFLNELKQSIPVGVQAVEHLFERYGWELKDMNNKNNQNKQAGRNSYRQPGD